MERKPVASGNVTFPSGSAPGTSITVDLGGQARPVAAYSIAVDNSASGSVPLTFKFYNQEQFVKTNGTNPFTKNIDFLTATYDTGEFGQILVNGLFICLKTIMVVTNSVQPSSNIDVYYTIREAL